MTQNTKVTARTWDTSRQIKVVGVCGALIACVMYFMMNHKPLMNWVLG